MPESFVNQATGRCSIDGSKYWFNCNPDGPFHWFKVNWIDQIKQKNLLYLHFTMDDNLSLSEKIKARYRSMYTGVFFQRYILGFWTVAQGIIYDMFDLHKHVIKGTPEELSGNRYVSIDYGTQNATVFLMWCEGISGKWYCTKEYYYSGRDKMKQKTDGEYCDDLIKFIAKDKVKQIIIDPSAASFIAEIRKRGLSIKRAKNDVLNGIRVTGTLIQTGKVFFLDECKETIKEFSNYIWDAKATNRGEDKPIKEHDHAMDAVRYFCYTILGKKRGASILK